MKKQRVVIAALIVLLALSIGTAAFFSQQNSNATLYANAIETARSEMGQVINATIAQSASIAIMDGGQIVYSEGFGLADREKNIPVDSNTVFNVGSISKTFCAAAVMVLVDEGKVNLDEPVVTYLPDFTMPDPRYVNITVRMLLDHSSGFPGTVWSNNFGYDENPNLYQELLAQLSKSYLKADPGTSAPYCNDGYTLAELLVTRVSGQSYMDFVTQRILEPLSLDNTGLSVGQLSDKTIAQVYSPANEQYPPEVISPLGAGGLSSTAEDLVRFADSFCDGGKHVLSDSSIAEMTKPQLSILAQHSIEQAGLNPEFCYGLGLDVAGLPSYQEQGVYLVGKGGDTETYHSMLLWSTNNRISVAVIETGNLGNMAPRVAVDVLNAVLQDKGLIQNTEANAAAFTPEPIPEQYAAFEGYYAPKLHVSFNFTDNTCKLVTFNPDLSLTSFQLYYQNNTFVSPDGSKFVFITVDGQNYVVISYMKNLVYTMWGQQLPQLDHPLSLNVDLNGMQWLRRNVASYEQGPPSLGTSHIVTSTTMADLPGYVNFYGFEVVASKTYAAVPASAVRDQNDLTVLNKNGQVWMQLSDCPYSPASLATKLVHGSNTVTIGGSGYNEWFVASNDFALTIQLPADGRVIVFSSDGTVQYDSAYNTGAISVPKGGFVEVAGKPGDVFTVTAS